MWLLESKLLAHLSVDQDQSEGDSGAHLDCSFFPHIRVSLLPSNPLFKPLTDKPKGFVPSGSMSFLSVTAVSHVLLSRPAVPQEPFSNLAML